MSQVNKELEIYYVCIVKEGDVEAWKYKISRRTKMSKLMSAFCERANMDLATTKFMYGEREVLADDYPQTINLINEDTIVAITITGPEVVAETQTAGPSGDKKENDVEKKEDDGKVKDEA